MGALLRRCTGAALHTQTLSPRRQGIQHNRVEVDQTFPASITRHASITGGAPPPEQPTRNSTVPPPSEHILFHYHCTKRRGRGSPAQDQLSEHTGKKRRFPQPPSRFFCPQLPASTLSVCKHSRFQITSCLPPAAPTEDSSGPLTRDATGARPAGKQFLIAKAETIAAALPVLVLSFLSCWS